MSFRKYFVGVLFFILLIWGPIDHSGFGGLIIRILYLVLIPIITWYLLSWIWKKWQPNKTIENIFERVFASFVSCALILGAIFRAIADTHIDNTQWIQTRDGMEAVGEYIIVSGPDWFQVVFLSLCAVIVFWYGVIKNKLETSG